MALKPGLIVLACAACVVTPVAAKDITMTLNDREQQAFLQMLDQATRAGGLQATPSTVYFLNKIQAAVNAPPAPAATSPEPKAAEPEKPAVETTPEPTAEAPKPKP
jgi:hypothetical protein